MTEGVPQVSPASVWEMMAAKGPVEITHLPCFIRQLQGIRVQRNWGATYNFGILSKKHWILTFHPHEFHPKTPPFLSPKQLCLQPLVVMSPELSVLMAIEEQ